MNNTYETHMIDHNHDLVCELRKALINNLTYEI